MEATPEESKDPLGRDTPRATVLGFLNAARKGNLQVAVLYLNTPLRGESSGTLAHQLAVVLDRRLPARLNEISNKPEGSLEDPLKPNQEWIGTISTENGPLDILVERVDRGANGKVWLFSRQTLASIPEVAQELNKPAIERFLPDFMVTTRIATIPIFEWLALFLGMPLIYLLTGLLNRIISSSVGQLRQRLGKRSDTQNPQVLRPPIRLLLLAVAIRWFASSVSLPLLARQVWNTVALMITIGACVWVLMLLNSWSERHLVARNLSVSGSASVLRLIRRLFDVLWVFVGLLIIFHHFAINVTAVLAGLGVGGIAVALAAQKTLENVIAGVSLVADRAVRVGDFVTLGDIQGKVEEVGLRSTRIRTLDRTLASLPNGQVANMKLETLSARDKFWFHPLVRLRHETTPAQLRSIMAGIGNLLSGHHGVDPFSLRVRFVGFGAFSLDLDIFAYVLASDTNDFLEIQEELLLDIMAIVHDGGTAIAFQGQAQVNALAQATIANP